jgi:hypothetical protein
MTRLQWADLSPYRAVLYRIEDDNPFNKKVAEVVYNTAEQSFTSLIFDPDSRIPLRDAQIDLPSKVEAMEAAMALLVASRFDRAK